MTHHKSSIFHFCFLDILTMKRLHTGREIKQLGCIFPEAGFNIYNFFQLLHSYFTILFLWLLCCKLFCFECMCFNLSCFKTMVVNCFCFSLKLEISETVRICLFLGFLINFFGYNFKPFHEPNRSTLEVGGEATSTIYKHPSFFKGILNKGLISFTIR